MAAGPRSFSILLPDGSTTEVHPPATAGEVLRAWRPHDATAVLAAALDGEPIDLARPLSKPGRLDPLRFSDPAGREILQHSAAHLVAKAVVERISDAKPTVGPPTDDGFYYDFDVRPISPEDVAAIRESIVRSVAARDRFVRREISRDDAERQFASNPHKLRYIAETPPGEPISVYSTGTFVDLCRGPHVPDTGWLAGLHLLGVSAVTQGGTADGLPLQRVRGIAFPTGAELETFLRLRSEAEARDHRLLGQKLDLFSFSEESPGLPFWHPNGMIVVRELERFVLEHLERAHYSEIRSPLLFAKSVYETSGHWEHYRENMFLTAIDDRPFGVKPMNCPGSMLIFRSRARSYRELPMRLAEFAPLHRLEASGTIHGLTRVREFVQDDAHIFVTEEQIEPEVRTLLEWVREAFTIFRLEWTYELSTRPKNFLGEPAQWDRAEATLEKALRDEGTPFKVSPGEGAFYGPKIDIHIRDSLGRPWQTGTIQLDYQMPLRFRLEYQGSDGALHPPVVVHRTILGSWERFLGVFLEHCAGKLPPWLSPVQVRVLPVSDAHLTAARSVATLLGDARLRVDVREPTETLSKRVREAELDRIPWIVVIGDKEIANGTGALRTRGAKGQTVLPMAELAAKLRERVAAREYDP